MSAGDERKKIQQALTNDMLTESFQTELGQKALVQRTTVDADERQDQLREVLSDIAKDLSATGVAPKGMEYLGSFSVHVYHSKVLRTAAFAVLNNGARVPFDLADAAMRELTGSVVEYHGRRRQKLRSGF